jgi:hypothetical protein
MQKYTLVKKVTLKIEAHLGLQEPVSTAYYQIKTSKNN